MGSSPTVAGGFFWAFADECVERTDQDRRIDCVGNAAPDGIVGPHHEKEGSYFTVRSIWSPVKVSDLDYENGVLSMKLRNEYDFTSLSDVKFTWKLRELPAYGSFEKPRVVSEGSARGPTIAPRQEQAWKLPVPWPRMAEGVLELQAATAAGPVHTWTLPVSVGAGVHGHGRIQREKSGLRVTGGDYSLRFNADGSLASLKQGDREIGLAGPSAFALIRDQRGFRDISRPGKLRKLELAPRADVNALAFVSYEGGTLKSMAWRVDAGKLWLSYELEANGPADIFGIRFAGPQADVQAKRWVGAGPYRVWKNRRAGPTFGLHEVAYNDPVPGESFTYPEFPGFFEDWRWLELRLRDSSVWFENRSDIPFFGLHRPQAGKQPVLELPDLGWSFLHAIPPIGTKFTLADVLGPQSQTTPMDSSIRGEIAIRITP